MKILLKMLWAGILSSIGVGLISASQEVFGKADRISLENICQIIINIIAVLLIYYSLDWVTKDRKKKKEE